MALLEDGFIPAITEVGRLFEQEEIFLPELMLAAEAMKTAAAICNGALPKERVKQIGRVVIGTVEGDIHDIGKSIVESFLSAHGFEVHDLGREVPTDEFIKRAVELKADVIATSAMLTTTMGAQQDLEDELRKRFLRDRFKTIIGGAPVDQQWADTIGADAYAEDASEAVQKIRELLGSQASAAPEKGRKNR
ncbi:MAG: cobalamin-dependent protein [Deltaproteobacteria bacterium]|nr:cobalamin-dependent protein [Deltaproteobacteria bacterium]